MSFFNKIFHSTKLGESDSTKKPAETKSTPPEDPLPKSQSNLNVQKPEMPESSTTEVIPKKMASKSVTTTTTLISTTTTTYNNNSSKSLFAFTQNTFNEVTPTAVELPAWIVTLEIQIMDGKKLQIKANQFDNVLELKKKIMEMHSIPVDHQHLFYNCKLLEDNYTLIYYEVENGVTLKMNLGETVEKCDFFGIRGPELLDPAGEKMDFCCEPEFFNTLCTLGQNRLPSDPQVLLTIQILNGKSFNIITSTLNIVGKMKQDIAEQEKIPIEHQHLFFNCKILENSQTLIKYEIQSGSVITMNLGMSMTGCRFYYLRPELFDMQYSCEYANTNMHNTGDMFCAGKPYIRPLEARRFAIKVRGKYEGMQWLGQPSTSTRVNPGEWPMAYHGTSEVNILEIVNSGFDLAKCVRFAFGKGIYCSPNPATALQYSADYHCTINKDGVYRVILQCRANPEKLKVVKAADAHQGEYWTVPDGADLRPYGVCVYYYPNGFVRNTFSYFNPNPVTKPATKS